VVAESHRVPGRQQLIGIVAHQCHETSDIAAQPGSDDRVGAYPEIVPKFGRHNLGQIKTSVSDGSSPSVAADGPGSLANTSGNICGVGAVVEVVTAGRRLDREGTTAE
jgi:hypothetical protein